MKTLELKHLAPYLPYGLNCKFNNSEIKELIGIRNYVGWSGVFREKYGENNIPLISIKPILRQLSDLTKEIEHNGEKFVPIEWIEERYFTLDLHKQCESIIDDERWINQCDYMLINHLFEWHFDVFGLIERGIAIDINTI